MLKHPVLKHFAILLLLAVLLTLTRLFFSFQGGPFGARDPLVSLHAAILHSPNWIYWLLPLAAGIAVGTGVGADHLNASIVTVALTLVLMVGLDVVAEPLGHRGAVAAAQRAPASWPLPMDTVPRTSPDQTLGAIRTTAAVLMGDAHKLVPYDDPHRSAWEIRRATAFSTFDLSMLILPLITVGVMIGIRSWLTDRVQFEASKDRLIALWVLSWLVVPIIWWVPFWWAGRAFNPYFDGQPLILVVLPTLVLLPLALLGWRQGIRMRSVGKGEVLPKTISSSR